MKIISIMIIKNPTSKPFWKMSYKNFTTPLFFSLVAKTDSSFVLLNKKAINANNNEYTRAINCMGTKKKPQEL